MAEGRACGEDAGGMRDGGCGMADTRGEARERPGRREGGGDGDGKRDESECDKGGERDGEIEQGRPATTSLALMPAIQISQCTSNTISPSSCARPCSRSRQTRADTHPRAHARSDNTCDPRTRETHELWIPRTKIGICPPRENH